MVFVFAACLFFTTQTARAEFFDFVTAIDNGVPYPDNVIKMDTFLKNGAGSATGELGGTTFIWEQGSLTLTATSSHSVYLDSDTAGMGVARELTGSLQADPSKDDNVTIGEVLNIGFGELVNFDLATTVFRDAGHDIYNTIPDGIEIKIDDGVFSRLNLLPDLSGIIGTNFSFRTMNNGDQFYIASAAVQPSIGEITVPEPSLTLLLGISLIGLVGVGAVRRVRQKAVVKVNS